MKSLIAILSILATPKDTIWAWQADGGRTILPDLENVLAAKLEAAKS
jgi:hypothetical protein